MPLQAGNKFGPYEILSPLGAGGMGEVYRARDTRLDRDVAIKVLPAHLTRNAEFKLRFDREAKSISQLAHPHVCTLYDVGHHDGTDYLVMELLEGESLAQRLARGALSLDLVLRHGAEIASALDAAHRKGVVHRDLKPGNVMLAKGGAKLLDFGLAKSSGVMDSDPSAVTVSQPLTSKGTILGTFQYMAPEQLEGSEADARTDIFALGAVLYEMATGKRAFDGASRASLIASIMSSQPRSICELQPTTPPALDRLIHKCLAKDPDARWQSAADVADELRWIAQSGALIRSDTAPRTRRQFRWTIATAAVVILVAWVVRPWLFPNRTSSAPPLHLSVTAPGTDVVDGGTENLAMAISPDGNALVYCARGVGGTNLYLRRMDDRDPKKIPGTEAAYSPFFSPDGEWIGFFSGSKLRKVSVRSGVSIPVADSLESRSGTWADDQTIAFAPHFGSPLTRISASGGAAEVFTTLDAGKRERTHRWPEALPGGEWVVFTVGTIDSPGSYDNATIEAQSLKTGERRLLVQGGRMARYAPPGYLVFARESVLYAVPINPRDPRVTDVPVPVLDGVDGETSSGASHFSISRNGTLAYILGTVTELDELVWVDMTGKVEPIGAPCRTYDQVRISPDGTQLLVAVGPARFAGDLWRYDLASGTLIRVTSEQRCASPCWTPDHRSIVYRTDAGSYEIKVQPVDGSDKPRVIHSDSDPVLISSVTPDGETVLFYRYGAVTGDVMSVPIDGSAPARAHWEEPGPQSSAVASPDGKWLAYVSRESGMPEVYVRSTSTHGGKWHISVEGGFVPIWAPSGKEIYFVRDDAMMAVSINAVDDRITAGVPRKLFDLPPGRHNERDERSFDISPDGKRFAMKRSANPSAGRRYVNVILNWSHELEAKVPLSGSSR